MTSSLCPRAVLGSSNSTISFSIGNFGSSIVQTSCPGLLFRAPVGVNELQGQNAGVLAWFISFQFLDSNYWSFCNCFSRCLP